MLSENKGCQAAFPSSVGDLLTPVPHVENFAICKNLWIHFAIHGSKPYNVKNKAKVWKDRTAIAQVKSNSGNRAAPHAHGHVRDGTQVSRISHTPSFHGAFNVKQSSAFVGSKQVQLDLTWFWCFFFKSKFYGHSSLFGECFGCCGVQEGGGKILWHVIVKSLWWKPSVLVSEWSLQTYIPIETLQYKRGFKTHLCHTPAWMGKGSPLVCSFPSYYLIGIH